VPGLLAMFAERGVGPLKGLNALVVDDISSILEDEERLAALVDLIVLVYNQLSNPGKIFFEFFFCWR
jgi:hypothetical protein